MARPIMYDSEEVLMKSMYLFWKKGYENTSIKDLVSVTGLKPGSLYTLYENKEGIFKAALERYSQIYLEKIEQIFMREEYTITNIETFLNEIVIVNISNQDTHGCLLVKTLLITPHDDKKIQPYIEKFFSSLELLLVQTIIRAKEGGETKVDAHYYAKFIITTIYGAHVYYKNSKDKEVLIQSVHFLLSTLKSTELFKGKGIT